jgi:hypothetical protein
MPAVLIRSITVGSPTIQEAAGVIGSLANDIVIQLEAAEYMAEPGPVEVNAERRVCQLFESLSGLMFGLSRSTFVGSYFFLISTRRA